MDENSRGWGGTAGLMFIALKVVWREYIWFRPLIFNIWPLTWTGPCTPWGYWGTSYRHNGLDETKFTSIVISRTDIVIKHFSYHSPIKRALPIFNFLFYFDQSTHLAEIFLMFSVEFF